MARPFILLVEDNPGDVRLTQIALRSAEVTPEIRVVVNGLEAMRFMQNAIEDDDIPLPDLVLLDINLPKKSGFEVLEEIRADPRMAAIPVVMLSSSENPADVERAYQRNANSFLAKSLELDVFRNRLLSLEKYWRDDSKPRQAS